MPRDFASAKMSADSLQRLNVVLNVRALAADVEAQALDFELVVAREQQ